MSLRAVFDTNILISASVHIVTGDRRHLLPLQAYQGIAILSAADFLHAASTSK